MSDMERLYELNRLRADNFDEEISPEQKKYYLELNDFYREHRCATVEEATEMIKGTPYYDGMASYFKVGFSFPVPFEKIREFTEKFDTVYVIEESEPYLEFQLRTKGINCIGREVFPQEGELSTAIIKEKVLGIKSETIDLDTGKIKERPPVFCAGCPHRGLFYELGRRAKSGKIFISGDIGCYGIAPLPPFSATDTVLCMYESYRCYGQRESSYDNIYRARRDHIERICHSGSTYRGGDMGSHNLVVRHTEQLIT